MMRGFAIAVGPAADAGMGILRGIHASMAGRFARLIVSLGARETIFVSGGLAADEGLVAALAAALPKPVGADAPPPIVTHPRSVFAGAIGAAIWGE